MDYLNLHISILDSEEFSREDPVNRATWLCLQKYAISQENGGKISNCREWKSRTWQQIAKITRREVMRKSRLWRWDGDDLIILYYPKRQEDAVKAKREAGRRGGRPRQTEEEPYGYVLPNHMPKQNETERETETSKEKETISLRAREDLTISASLVKAAMPVLGATADMTLLHWLGTWPEAWIVQALAITARKNLNGGSASYCEGILRRWKKNGGPEREEPGRPAGARAGSGHAGADEFDAMDERP